MNPKQRRRCATRARAKTSEQVLLRQVILWVLLVLRAPNLGARRKLFCKNAVLPLGSHQTPLYIESRQNRLHVSSIFKPNVSCSEHFVVQVKHYCSQHWHLFLEFLRVPREMIQLYLYMDVK